MKLIKGLAIALACVGMILPANVQAGSKPAATAPSRAIQDVALKAGGTFTGQVVDDQGQGLDGAVVAVRQGDRSVAETVTNQDGYFSVTNLKGGVYQVTAGQGEGVYRLWTEKAAPPSAKSKVMLVSGSQNVVRGQFDDTGMWVVGGIAVGAMVVNLINMRKLNDIHEDLHDVRAQNNATAADLAALQATVDAIAASTP